MGSVENPLGKGPKDPYEKYRVEPIGEKEKKAPPFRDGEPKGKKGFFLLYTLLMKIKNALERLLNLSSETPSIGTEAFSSIRLLKTSFEKLKKEDLSQDAPFLQQLSKRWLNFIERMGEVADKKALIVYKSLLHAIDHYPEESAHSLGYYLTEFAGQRWVPFPYMELIQKIHHEHKVSPENSPLTRWTKLLDTLFSLLQNNDSFL